MSVMNNRVRIKIGSIEFEAEGDSEIIEREREQFFNLLPQVLVTLSPAITERIPMVEISPDVSNNYSDNSTVTTLLDSPPLIQYESIASFLNSKSFGNDVDLVMGVSYYLDCIEKNSSFTAKEVENKLSEARRGRPSNTSHCINLNIKKGFIGESSDKKDGKKAYRVLSEGIKWCESYIPSEMIQKKKTVKSNPSTESSLLSFPLDELNLDNYCEISSLEKLDEQILVMMLIYTKEKNIDYFSFEDIVSVLKTKFKVPVTSRKVQYFFEKSGTKFDRKTEKKRAYHKLMSSGIKEAEKIVFQFKEGLLFT
jgi:hypothetical protein